MRFIQTEGEGKMIFVQYPQTLHRGVDGEEGQGLAAPQIQHVPGAEQLSGLGPLLFLGRAHSGEEEAVFVQPDELPLLAQIGQLAEGAVFVEPEPGLVAVGFLIGVGDDEGGLLAARGIAQGGEKAVRENVTQFNGLHSGTPLSDSECLFLSAFAGGLIAADAAAGIVEEAVVGAAAAVHVPPGEKQPLQRLHPAQTRAGDAVNPHPQPVQQQGDKAGMTDQNRVVIAFGELIQQRLGPGEGGLFFRPGQGGRRGGGSAVNASPYRRRGAAARPAAP